MLKPITLVGEQRKVLTLNHEGPIQIKGAAGSGKTTVAVYRACHLMDTYQDLFEPSKVAIFTFNKSLAGYLDDLTARIDGNSSRGLTVINFHSWAYRFLERHGVTMRDRVLASWNAKKIIERIVSKLKTSKPDFARILSKSSDFYMDEIAWLKGKVILTLNEYLETKRSGRGTSDRVTTKDKEVLWDVFIQYKQELTSSNKYDFDDFALMCLDVIKKQGSSFNPPFTHVVIDEAQDLSKAEVSVLSQIVSPTTSSITIIADAAQRIYKSGFVWKEVGLNVTGARTIEFKKNYRNTEAIARAALSLLAHDSDSGDFTQVEVNQRKGDKPKIITAASQQNEYAYVAEAVKVIQAKSNDTICILHRTNQGVKNWNDLLESQGVSTSVINGSSKIDFSGNSVKLATMQSVKGLEFDHIFICSLYDTNLPIAAGFSDEDDDLHITTERRLLYTCMTRATQTLTLSYCGTPSRYLKEINKELVKKVSA